MEIRNEADIKKELEVNSRLLEDLKKTEQGLGYGRKYGKRQTVLPNILQARGRIGLRQGYMVRLSCRRTLVPHSWR